MPNSHFDITEIWINKNDISQTKVTKLRLDSAKLNDQQVILKIDTFGFSANNITYALMGEKMAYWGFFAADDGWGKVPVWGFATVVASKHPDVQVGEKVFGYLPMASHLLITAGKTSATHFFDVDEKRKSISPVYDNYVRCATDPGYQADREAWQLNYRPLFMTSFVLDDYVGEQLEGGLENTANSAADTRVKNVLLSSASSKTAYGAAHLLMKHKAERGANYQVIGLTSASNKAFTESLGCYDRVLTYQEIDAIPVDGLSWLLDFAGNKSFILALQKQLGKHLSKMIFIGATDVKAQDDKPIGHLDGELFFAPSQVKKRTVEWGSAGFGQKYAQAWQSFSAQIADKVSVADYAGADEIQRVYKVGLEGKLNNLEINVLKF
ncbi:MAG: hypothetical protein ACI8Z9_002564 [Paraglaciecola sp.]|jgi:hypothetical protein